MNQFMRSKSFKGFTLIEVLVAVLILGTGLLALSSLQLRSLQQNHDAYVHTRANIVAYQIMDQVRALSDAPPANVKLPSQSDINNLTSVLPGGEGSLDCNNRICTVTVSWSEARGVNEDGLTSTFTYTTNI